MKALIITVAGTSSRFSKSIGKDTLKCIYTDGDPRQTLLYRMMDMAADSFDEIIVVGGFKFDELTAYIETTVDDSIQQKVHLVHNPHYADRGSGWSLYLAVEALKALRGPLPDSVIFAEGDLYVDASTFHEVVGATRDVITCNPDVIDATKSVAFYCDRDYRPHYIYDVSHGTIEIHEPFTRIYNSGQMWGFSDVAKLIALSDGLGEEAHAKTNLELVNRYYSDRPIGNMDVFKFETWINCNTVEDYRRAFHEGE